MYKGQLCHCQLNSKNNGPVLLIIEEHICGWQINLYPLAVRSTLPSILRLKTVSCCLMYRMAIMDMNCNLNDLCLIVRKFLFASEKKLAKIECLACLNLRYKRG